MHELTDFEPKNYASFADRVTDWLHEGSIVREGLAHEGQEIVWRLTVNGRFSLRQLAGRAGLSPTYLSMVAHGKSIISPEAFLKLADIERQG